MELNNFEIELKELGEIMANVLIAEIQAKGKVASGTLLNSVEHRIERTPASIKVQLWAADYLKYVSEGRRAGYPSGGDGSFLKALIEWVIVKGIESDRKAARSAAYAIRESIFKKGIPPTDIIPFVIEEIQRKITSDTRDALQKDIDQHIRKKTIEALAA